MVLGSLTETADHKVRAMIERGGYAVIGKLFLAFSYGVILTGNGAMAKMERYSCKLKCYK